jgi:hypothetical protein
MYGSDPWKFRPHSTAKPLEIPNKLRIWRQRAAREPAAGWELTT